MRLSVALKSWKQAATLILTAKKNASVGMHSDYQVLMLARSSKSKFMPSMHVFPGGMTSDVDFSAEWLDLYAKAGVNDITQLVKTPNQPINERPPMFVENKQENQIPNDIALRICAIRETFEEAGVLIARKINGDQIKFSEIKEELKTWRNRVVEDASYFAECCRSLGVIPNVWALHEWSNWLTPTHMTKRDSGKRFDTAFYIACLQQQPPAVQDNREITLTNWDTPSSFLSKYADKSLMLAPPQIYELSRLLNYSKLDELSDFAAMRSLEGCERWLPVRINCKDAVLSVLPGDALYPSEPDIEGNLPIIEQNCTAEESQRTDQHLHRYVFYSPTDCKLLCNVPQKYNHLPPILPENCT